MVAEGSLRILIAAVTLDEVVGVGEGAGVQLADEAVHVILASRRVVDDAITRGDRIYGVTTGVGHARDDHHAAAALRALQPVLVEMHVDALGPPLSTQRVRAGMVTRLIGFARGGAGVSVRWLEAWRPCSTTASIPSSRTAARSAREISDSWRWSGGSCWAAVRSRSTGAGRTLPTRWPRRILPR